MFPQSSKLGTNIERQPVMTVLIADMEATLSSPLATALEEIGFHICLARTNDDVRRHLRERPIGFALTELLFDDGDGFDVIELVAEKSPSCRIVVHSRFCNLANAVRAVKAGADDVLPKPTPTDLLLAVLFDDTLDRDDLLVNLPNPEVIRRKYIVETVQACGANSSRAARQLSMHKRTLTRLLQRMATLAPRSPLNATKT